MGKFLVLVCVSFALAGCASTKPVQTLETSGVHHIGLTVKDLNLTADFFIKALNLKKVGEKKDYPAIFVTDGTVLITLWQAQSKTPVNFNRKNNIGLHHLALKLNSFTALDSMYEKLKVWPGVRFEFSPELMGNGPNKHMILYEPGGIRIEFAVTPKN